ncbi:hypothetical protein BYZ73_16720 [Rhodovulum viride]|uniref:Type VI secretion system tube protein Hcp n=1 Tax=Rhodovulum viride TaxID=1231134 RepID=A0ABX9DF10_9RHOB|nr:type VI secretion system tube protein Hcp [Rhodovulum viride]RAP40181.1 hypothetical protein BYZ73_16720 [Rhodovulum viride]
MTLTACMKLPDIEGESVRPGHEREIDVFDIHCAPDRDLRTGAGTGHGRGRPALGPLSIRKGDDAAASHLAPARLIGKPFPEARTVLWTSCDDMHRDLDYLTIPLTNAAISLYEILGADGGPTALRERVDPIFEAVIIRYIEQAADQSAGTPDEIDCEIGARA